MAGTLTDRLRSRAEELGVDLFGVTDLVRSEHVAHFRDWLSAGHHGSMAYLEREETVARRADLSLTLQGVRSAVVVGVHYRPEPRPTSSAGDGQPIVARYALGRDYHEVLPPILDELAALIGRAHPGLAHKVYVDTGPLFERELARAAGLGWFGRNTMLIHPDHGSWFVLGVLLTDAELSPSEERVEDRCGSCRACVDACPTGALLGYDERGAPVLDARRCISYLTIESKGAIPLELRSAMGRRVFGCDICQEVCPWNERFGRMTSLSEFELRDDLDRYDLLTLTRRILAMSEKGYQRAFAGSPLARPRRRGMLRNLCVGLGNWIAEHDDRAPEGVTGLLAEALDDAQPLVRMHAAWALGQSGEEKARRALDERLESESDMAVRLEIEEALSRGRSPRSGL